MMKVLECEPSVQQDPHRMPSAKLNALGVRLLNKYDLLLQCVACGETWSPRTGRDGRLPGGYWQCPHKCNL
jgi:hypothetical protein